MPLTNVWTRNHRGIPVRTTAAAMDREYDHSVSALSHTFRCYNCFQYVTFVKGNEYRVSHFKHSAGEESKDCEDRTFGTGGYTYGIGIDSVPDPMRLQFDGERPYLEIGFFPVSASALDRAIQNKTKISICGKFGAPDVYNVDRTRFEPHSMTWLPLPFSWALDYSVKIEPFNAAINTWEIHRTPLLKHGTVFDAETGKRIPEKSDIAVGRTYYIVCRRGRSFYSCNGISMNTGRAINDQWYLYRMIISSFTESAMNFCFDELRLVLTTEPSDIQMLWPPVIEGDNLIDTNQKQLYLYVKGESDFETYPTFGIRNKNVYELDAQQKIFELNVISTLQMVSTTRYSQRLKFLYIRPLEDALGYAAPTLSVLDDHGQEVADNLKSVPPRGILRILSEVDAVADVEDQDGFLYRLEVTAGEEARLLDLKQGMRITIRQGMEVLRTIVIGTLKKAENAAGEDVVVPWRGKLVLMPPRYAWILTRLDHSGELYRRTAKALNDGVIPQDGLKKLIAIAEGMRYGK